MAEIYITMQNLSRAMERYDSVFKLWADNKVKSYFEAITFDNQDRKLRFYTIPAPVPEGTVPYLEVEIPPGADELDALYSVSMETPLVPDEGKFKTHVFYQGTGDNKVEIGRINLEYDTVVESGVIIEATPQDPIEIGGQTITEGKYFRLTIRNNENPVYISLEDFGANYTAGNGINIDSNAIISIEVDAENANGLEVGANGLKLNLAVAPDVEHGIAGSAGAITAEEKAILSSFSVANEQQIRDLFN